MRAAPLLWVLLAPSAHAAVITLSPATSQVGYTAYALGFLPVPAHFEDFAGTLTTNAGMPANCQVEVSVRIASLHMADPARVRVALGPSMLDASRFPTMRYLGHCAGAVLDGQLTLHGITHPLVLTMQLQGREVTATGMVMRRDYDVGGMLGLVSQRIRIQLHAVLPRNPGP